MAVLQDPVRRRLYEFVVGQGRAVGRAEAAEAAGVQRTLAAFHLDKLIEAGLLEAVFRRPPGRTGPGAGRPAKLYQRTRAEYAVSLPSRDYRTAAELLAEVAEALGADAELNAVARRHGSAIQAREDGGTLDRLRERGYEPYRDGEVVRMRNCPFHALATAFPPLVCGMNLALMEGLLAEDGDWTARMDSRPGECCVALVSKTNQA